MSADPAIGRGAVRRHLSWLVVWALLTLAPPSIAATWLQITAPGHAAPIMRLAASAARDLVVTASDDKTARLWTLSEGRPLGVLRPPIGPARVGRLFGAAIHPSLDLVAVAGSGSREVAPGPSIWFFRASNGQFVRRIDAQGEHVRRLTFSEDGRWLAACYAQPGALRIFDLETGALAFEDRFAGDCLALAARGPRFAVGVRDGTASIYRQDADRITPLQRFATGADVLSVDLTAAGDRLVAGFFTAGAGAAVFDTASGRTMLRLRAPTDVLDPRPTDPISTTQAVRFEPGERTIVTGGSTSRPGSVEGRVHRFDAVSGAWLEGRTVADDTITDLTIETPVSSDARSPQAVVIWGSFAGSWGVWGPSEQSVRASAGVDFLAQRAASRLLVSADGQLVQWQRGIQGTRVEFDLLQRRAGSAQRRDLLGPRTRRGLFDSATNFEDHFRPEVGGRRLALDIGEVSRALTFVGDEGDVVLGTSESLRRIDRRSQVVWDVRPPTEVRAVNATADGGVVIAQLNDGTLRWWRSSDGALLLSALVAPEGWVLWTPTGHYDASHGMESRIGWLVDRGDAPTPDFFSVGRFRDIYLRPDVIDRVLVLRDPERAVQVADAVRHAQLNRPAETVVAAPAEPKSSAATAVQPPPAPAAAPPTAFRPVDEIRPTSALVLPPVLAPVQALRVSPSTGPVRLSFSLRTDMPREALRVEARLDGKLIDPVMLSLPPSLDGRATGEVVIDPPSAGRLLQLVARAGEVASEPLRFLIDRKGAVPIEPSGPAGRLFIVAIGVGQYRDPSIRLRLPGKDAADFVGVMQAQKGALYEDVQVRMLTEERARRPAIEEAMRWLEAEVKDRDVGVVFLAGHGVNDPNGRYHFLPWDYDALRPAESAIPGTVFAAPLARIKGRALLILDTCFAANAASVLPGGSTETAGFTNAVAAPENSVTVFASSTGRQFSYELPAWGNGAFTKYLTQGLNGGARLVGAPLVTTRSLSPFVQEGVARLTEGRQTPVAVIPEGVPERILAKPPL